MTLLSVNVNKVATLRNTRPLDLPSVTKLSTIALDAGAHGITVHPRPDHRHIRPQDVYDLAELVARYPHAEFNIEGNPFHEYMQFARDIRPHQCTLVPDDASQATSDHGWRLQDAERLIPIVAELKSLSCRVSLFMDAVVDEVELAAKVGADRIELYTEPYARAFSEGHAERAVEPYLACAERARSLGLEINAGHDLNLRNLPYLVQSIPWLKEVSIGHALIADALELGMAETVRRYLDACASISS
jgi:pyridoxine 5-phosphate synthase